MGRFTLLIAHIFAVACTLLFIPLAAEDPPIEGSPCCVPCCAPGEVFEDAYLQGYIQSLLDVHYNEVCVQVVVRNGYVYLSNLSSSTIGHQRIVCFVRSLPCVRGVCICDTPCCNQSIFFDSYRDRRGAWFPQAYLLFQTLVGATRQVVFGCSMRFNDAAFGQAIAFTSFGEVFPIYRWYGVGPWKADVQVDIEAAVWSLFEWTKQKGIIQGDACALVDADYYVGLPLSYAVNCWSFRLRLYHISCHLGDEFLILEQLADPDFQRLNPSDNAIDFFASYYRWKNALRLYAGVGYIFDTNVSFPMKPWYFEYGAELRLFGRRIPCTRLHLQPYAAMNFTNTQDRHWNIDQNYVAGLEFSRLARVGRKVRFYGQYHTGFSEAGQFSRLRTHYLALNLSYGY
jgi:Protein of unknown function (DUF1207)